MKKLIALVLVLIIASFSVIAYAHESILSAKDKAEITETAVYGDKNAAKGIEAKIIASYKNILFWDTGCEISDTQSAKTNYSFFNHAQNEPVNHRFSGVFLNASVHYALSDANENSTGITKAYYDILKSMSEGEEKTVKIKLADYYDYYPLDISIDTPIGFLSGNTEMTEEYAEDFALIKAFKEYFKIPVSPDDEYELTVKKESGYGSHISSLSETAFVGDTVSALASDACYFTFAYSSEKADMSLIPGGYGIYKLPYKYSANEDYGECFDYENLSTVYKLNEKEEVLFLEMSKDEKEILLFTSDEASVYLNVIDEETYELSQKMKISDKYDGSYYQYLYNDAEDFMAFVMERYKIVVINKDEKGAYQIALTSFLDDTKAAVYNIGYRTAMDFNGERLAVMGNLSEGNDILGNNCYNCDFYVAVFDETGVIFKGDYKCSLSASSETEEYGEMCRPIKPYEISFKK